MTEYKRYFRSEECVGLSMLHIATIALSGAYERLTGDEEHKGQGRLEKMGIHGRVKAILGQIRKLEMNLLETEPDIDHRIGLARKVNSYQFELKAAPQRHPEFHIISGDDMETLVQYALGECSLNCPCLVTNETDGSAEVILEAVAACETRKLFKRILLTENEGGFCPYYGR